ncbi:MAG: KpsF/GutQ family sugar-phosphate isomerase [Flavobacteriaceae bacterium]|nr:KpsF/GutQ family sugar-phosphate isomerase [Flavobacteriaceae bacterium]
MKKIDLNKISKDVLDNYTSSVSYVEECIDENFEVIIDFISKINGRVIITGIGKSAIIGMKISATLNSTGTPSIFLHGSDALHGDIGVATKNDVMICLSKSGSNTETVDLVKQIKKLGIILIGITSDKNSFLAKNADYSIVNKIEREACPNNLAPTTSTSMQLLIGDLIAICLMSIKEFKSEDFALYHPSGSLGKKLTLKVSDILNYNSSPKVDINLSIKDAINEISSKMYGATAVLDKNIVVGIITDGDIRRVLNQNKNPMNLKVNEIMVKNPKFVSGDMLGSEALNLMNKSKITQLLVIDDGYYKGMIHMHELLKAGL